MTWCHIRYVTEHTAPYPTLNYQTTWHHIPYLPDYITSHPTPIKLHTLLPRLRGRVKNSWRKTQSNALPSSVFSYTPCGMVSWRTPFAWISCMSHQDKRYAVVKWSALIVFLDALSIYLKPYQQHLLFLLFSASYASLIVLSYWN